jgi:hypothetical protein
VQRLGCLTVSTSRLSMLGGAGAGTELEAEHGNNACAEAGPSPRSRARDSDVITEVVVKSGQWMAQEKPVDVNVALSRWLATKPARLLAQALASPHVARPRLNKLVGSN